MCRVVSRALGPTPAAVAESRAFVAGALRRWDLDSLVLDAELLTSELVTNAVLHAGTELTVTVAVADDKAEVGVADRSHTLPRQRPAGAKAEDGRGLRLVEMVSRDWGVVDTAGGKQVWFRLDVDRSWPHRAQCPCGGEDLERTRMESGLYAVAAPGPWDHTD